MTRKDYQLIAEVMYALHNSISEPEWKDVVNTLAEALQGENPNFKFDKFIKACGWYEPRLVTSPRKVK